MTFEETCAFIRRGFWTFCPAPLRSPFGDASGAALKLEWALNENEIDVDATVAQARAELVSCLSRCSQDEIAACLAVGDAEMREAAVLALGLGPRVRP